MSGQKIIDGLNDAIAGKLTRVTIDGQTWALQSRREEEKREALENKLHQYETDNIPILRDQIQQYRNALERMINADDLIKDEIKWAVAERLYQMWNLESDAILFKDANTQIINAFGEDAETLLVMIAAFASRQPTPKPV